MSKKRLATLGLAAWMAVIPLASSAQKDSIGKDVNKNLIEAIDTSKDQKTDSINFLDAQRDLELRKDIQELLENEFADNKEIKQLKEKYGEEFVLDQMTSIVSLIARDADYYWTFNQNGDYILNEKKVQKLLKDIFPDTTKLVIWTGVIWAITTFITLSVVAWISEKINDRKRKKEEEKERKREKKRRNKWTKTERKNGG